MKHPRNAFTSQAVLKANWDTLGYTAEPDLKRAQIQFDQLVGLLEKEGVRLHFLPSGSDTGMDSLYTHDPVTAIGEGLILCRMGKDSRAGEPNAFGRFAETLGLPVLGRIRAPGLLEGGDLVWLDESTVAIGIGYRSNDAGASQIEELGGVEVIRVSLPHWNGPEDVLHLMSLISPVDKDLALVYRRLLPVTFLQELERRGYRLVDVPDQEFESLGCNVLTLAPRRCLVLDGNPVTADRLMKAGCEVVSFRGSEIAMKGQGGPTCLTRPIVRS